MRGSWQVGIVVVLATTCWCGCGSKKTNEVSFTQMIDGAQAERDPELRARKLIDIAVQARAVKDMPDAAAASSKALQAAEQIKNSGTKAEVLLLVAKESADAGSRIEASKAIESAKVAVDRIDDRPAKVEATITLAEAVLKFESPETRTRAAGIVLNGAESLVEGVTDAEQKIPLMAKLAVVKMTVAGKDAAQPILKQAAEQAATIADPRKRVRTQSNAAARLYDGGRGEEGKAFYDAALATAAGLTDPQARGYALLDVVEALSPHRTLLPLAQLTVEAEAAAMQMKDQDQRTILLRQIQAVRTAPR